MLRQRTRFLIGLMGILTMALMLVGTAAAQGPVGVLHTDPYWTATYWNNMTFSGAPALQRNETTLDHDWGLGSPAGGVSADRFSARWTRYLDMPAGTYRFTATGDDGIRVWVDGELIINEWNDHAAKTVNADKTLIAGHHVVTVEYYENGGLAVAKVSWERSYLKWRGEYFNNSNLSGSPVLVREDASINFDWGHGSPHTGIVSADNFSVRWTRAVDLPAGHYHFEATTDDGARLWVNGHHLIEGWFDQAARTFTGDIYLPGGPIPIIMEYYEHTDLASARLTWYKMGSSPDPIPVPSGKVIVDDTDPGFVMSGSVTGWRNQSEGYGGHLTWTLNNDWARQDYNWGRWYPNLSAERYEVFVYIPERYTTASAARYWISHADGFTLRVVNQSESGSRWISLGTYRFRGDDRDYVSLSDVTYESRLSRLVAWDAMKWEPR